MTGAPSTTAEAIALVAAATGPDWPGLVEDVLGAPVALTSYGPTAAGKHAMASALRPGLPATRW